ncbi:sensor histidine kinase [Lentzea aerocolonigenes]|uniref:sensor histidine kinase n=1 Tax=Lentzea aerocolonigenes TaxID=68170 RepID=UPI00069176CA|nr:histidine kinase [Lentzea aerocolonigenes]MCP2244418.1 Signal transduction histidine kinase [Lentzea aerocolonigenes]
MRFEVCRTGSGGRKRELLTDVAAVVVCGGIDLISADGFDEAAWVIGAAGLLSVRRKFPAAAAVLVASIGFLTPGQLFAVLFCALYTVGTHARVGAGSLAVVVALAGLTVPLPDDDELVNLTFLASEVVLQIVLPLAFGLYIRRYRQMVVMQRDQAVARERDRIACEMHDVLGHKLSLIALHAGKLELTGTADTETARLLGGTSRAAMRDLRQIIGVLDAEPVTVADLVESSRRAGVRVESRLSDDLRTLPPRRADAVRRVVQEALTNVHKHAGAVDVVVEFEIVRGRPRLTVRNSPPAQPPRTCGTGSGRGLATLASDVESLGGTMSWGPRTDGGFEVTAIFEAAVSEAGGGVR